ncbi:hypothetical protein [Actinoplanes sp. NPDC026619]|uniref:hypothetical protein n=1 Tax=Actinoplanes sp. NPDC026619 TaxID=3155798 RepID=UPI0034113129
MTDVQIVRGELQPWTDTNPTGGATLLALLGDLLPLRSQRTLVAGPHSVEVIELAAARSESVSVLVRSVTDAQELHAAVKDNVTVITGALDGLALSEPEPFDVIIAADGLDRVLGADSPALNWPQRAAELWKLAGPETLAVVGVENEFALTGLYDRRPLDERHGDDEWRPLHDDPDRPTSPAQVMAALGAERLYATFDHTLLDTEAAATTRPGRPGARLAIGGLTAAGAHQPLLAPLGDGADAAARAGLLAAVAPGWLAIRGTGGGATHTAYAPAGSGVLIADLDGDEWTVSADGGGKRLPDTESVETLLFRLAAAEDVPAFRAFAARLGAWANDEGVILLDDLFPDGETDGFVRGFTTVKSTAGTSELLAAAYQRLRDRLLTGHRRHPWPPWTTESDDLVTTWLSMSGVQATPELLKRGREIADQVAEPGTSEPDLRTILADAEEAKVRAVELAGKVFGLERTLRFRDQSLRTREKQIRTVRDDLRGLRRSPVIRLHELTSKMAKIRNPRKFAGALKRRIRKS